MAKFKIARKPEIWKDGLMKATFEVPDELFRAMKLRAASEGRKLKDVVAEVVRRGLSESVDERTPGHRVNLPLIQCRHTNPESELGPEQIADVLTAQEASSSRDATGR